jgi:PASTA domain-containing protein
MTDRTAVPERVSQRAKTARRGGGSGSQTVGDYVGQPAGEAAQAVRRAGLRPGLDRSFGCPAELIGLVVAQDPAAGSDLARNGMVTLYVAAPGGEPQSGNVEPAASGEFDETPAATEPIEKEPSPPRPVPARRRRKPDHARRLPVPADAPLEPSPPPAVEEKRVIDSPALTGTEPPSAGRLTESDLPDGALEDELADDEFGGRQFPHEDFVVHVEDVLAGRSGPPGWRRAYPRRQGVLHGLGNAGHVRTWVREHRMLAGFVGLALVLWMVIGLASTLDGRHARPLPARTVAPKPALAAKHHDPAPKPAAQKRTARPARSHSTRRVPHPARPRRAPAARAPVRTAAPGVSEAGRPVPRPASTPQPSEAQVPRASAPEQSGGGLFSP